MIPTYGNREVNILTLLHGASLMPPFVQSARSIAFPLTLVNGSLAMGSSIIDAHNEMAHLEPIHGTDSRCDLLTTLNTSMEQTRRYHKEGETSYPKYENLLSKYRLSH